MSYQLRDKATRVIQIGTEDPVETAKEEAIEVINSLRRSPASIPSKYYFDHRGAELLEALSGGSGHSPSRIETEILDLNLEEISRCIGSHATLVEPGIRNEEKTRTLLAGLNRVEQYIPIDLYGPRLERFASELRVDFPKIKILPVCADYSQQLPLSGESFSHLSGSLRKFYTSSQQLPLSSDNFSERRIFFFSDGLLGNFEPAHAEHMLRQFRFRAGLNSGLLLGVDLRRPADLLAMGNQDSDALWAKFHLNALTHLNNRFQANIDVNDFEHRVRYDSEYDRVEMSLKAVRGTSFVIAGEHFQFPQGHEIVAKYTHSYDLATFDSRLRRCGWRLRQSWTDSNKTFAVMWAEAWAI